MKLPANPAALALGLLALPAHGRPLAPGEGTLIVLNKRDDTASLIDPASGETRHVVPTGHGPHEVAVTRDQRLAIVADYGDEVPGRTLTVIDIDAGRALHEIDLGDYRRPHGLAWIPGTDRLLVTAEVQRALLEVDVAKGVVLRAMPTEAGASHMVVATPDGTRAFVANIASGSVSAIDLSTGGLLATIPTGAGCEGLDVTPDGSQVWTSNRAADTVSVIDARTLEVLATVDVPGFPIRVKITPDGKRALVSCAKAGEVAVLDVATRELVGAVGMQLLAREAPQEHMFGQAFGASPAPIGIQIHPDGKIAYVASTSTGRVEVIDLASLELSAVYEAGREPDGLGWASRP